MGERLRHGPNQFITQLAHLRFLELLMAAANEATAFLCSAVKSARSFFADQQRVDRNIPILKVVNHANPA
jgi:hypothetical protein